MLKCVQTTDSPQSVNSRGNNVMGYRKPTLADVQRLFPDHRVNPGGGINIVCPAHPPTSAPPQRKLWIHVDPESGNLKFLCRTRGCGHWPIWDKLGFERPPKRDPHKCGRYCVSYERQDGKTIRRHREDHAPGSCGDSTCAGKHVWGPKGQGPRGVHFRFWHDSAGPAEPYVVVEGEKAACYVAEAGLTAATWWGGSSSPHLVDYSRLAGLRLVVWPDDDEAGRKASELVATKALAAGAASVRMVSQDPPGHDGLDAADFSIEDRLRIVQNATTWTPPEASDSGAGLAQGGWFHEDDARHVEDWETTYLSTAVQTLRFNSDKLLATQDHSNSWDLCVDSGRGLWVKNRGALHDGVTRALTAFSYDCWRAFDSEKISQGTFKSVVSWKRKLRNSAQQDKVLDSVSEAITRWQADGSMPSGLLTCKESDLDAPSHYLGAPNGVIDLTTGRLLPPSEGRGKLISMSIRDPYDPHATDPAVRQLFSHLTSDELTWLLQGLGFALRRTPSRRIYLLQGESGGGKSTLLNHMSNSLGDYMNAIPTGLLEEGLSGAGGNPELNAVARPAIAFRCEPPERIDVPFLKSVAGGDEVTFRLLYSNSSIRRKFTATLLLACNVGNEPNLPLSRDDGLVARVRVLRYPAIPEAQRDPHLDQRLNTQRARQSMIALLVNAALTLDRPPADILPVQLASENLREKSQSEAEAWMRSVLRWDPSSETDAAHFWQEALAAAGEDPDSNRAWGVYRNKLSQLGSKLGLMPSRAVSVGRNGAKIRVFEGLRMLPPGATECKLCALEFPDGADDPAFDSEHDICQDAVACGQIQDKNAERTAVQGELSTGTHHTPLHSVA